MILGNGRMVSRWPARGGPVIRDGIVYFAAGIWQSDGVFLHAIDAAVGRDLWRNDDAGKIYMPQPHGGAMAESGVSAQGYLVATADHLLVPTGRAVPAGFQRRERQFPVLPLAGQRPHRRHAGRGHRRELLQRRHARLSVATGALEGKLGAGHRRRHAGGHRACGQARSARASSSSRRWRPIARACRSRRSRTKRSGRSPDVDGSAAVIVAGRHDRRRRRNDRDGRRCQNRTKPSGSTRSTALPTAWRSAGRAAAMSAPTAARSTASTASSIPSRAVIRQSQPPGETRTIVARRRRRDRAPHGREGRLLPGPGLRRRRAWRSRWPQRTNLQIYALSPSADEVAAARKKLQRGGPVWRARHRASRRRRQAPLRQVFRRPGGLVALAGDGPLAAVAAEPARGPPALAAASFAPAGRARCRSSRAARWPRPAAGRISIRTWATPVARPTRS